MQRDPSHTAVTLVRVVGWGALKLRDTTPGYLTQRRLTDLGLVKSAGGGPRNSSWVSLCATSITVSAQIIPPRWVAACVSAYVCV